MEELHKTQEHPIERMKEERRTGQRPFEGEDRRKAARDERLTPPGKGDMPS